MIFEFSAEARDQLEFWSRSDPSKIKRIKAIMKAIEADPFVGIANPEPLRHQLAGWWSRRINREHRFVYRIEGDRCKVLSCRFHYDEWRLRQPFDRDPRVHRTFMPCRLSCTTQ